MTNATDDWTDRGNEIDGRVELWQLVAEMRSEVRHMAAGLSRAAWGAVTGCAWVDADRRPTQEEILDALDMTVTPAGTSARDAVLRQSLAGLVAALEAADKAALTVWLAHVNASDPDRKA